MICVGVLVFLSSRGLVFIRFELQSFSGGWRFNEHPLAIFYIPEPLNTRKLLAEGSQDIRSLGTRGVYLLNSQKEECLHKVFLKGHLANDVAR